MDPLQTYATIYGVYTSEQDAKDAVTDLLTHFQPVNDGSIALNKGDEIVTFEYTGADSNHVIPLSESSLETPFYIVSMPKNPTKYGAQIYTLTIRKLSAKIVEATTSAGAQVRPVDTDEVIDTDENGQPIYRKSDFTFYEADDAANPYKDLTVDHEGKNLPTFVIKVRYPDSGNAARLKLTTENTLTWVGLDGYDYTAMVDRTIYKKADANKIVELDVTLPPEADGKAIYHLRTRLETNGLTAVPQEYMVVLEFADKGTGLLKVEDYKDSTYKELDKPVRQVMVDGNLSHYHLAVPASYTTVHIRAVAGNPETGEEATTSTTQMRAPAADGTGSFLRHNPGDPIHIATLNVTLDERADTAEGQPVEILVIDEAGNENIYVVRVVRESNDTDVLVYTVNTADGNDALEPVDVKDGSSDSTTKDKEPWASYITWVERDASTVPFRIVSKEANNAHYLSIWMPRDEKGQPFWFSASEPINANTWAKENWHPTEDTWKANVKANGDPIGEILGQLTLNGDSNAALRKAMETGIYIPF